jgi:hypothetical protein
MTLLRFDRKFTKRRTVTGFLDLVETNMSGAVSELFGRVDRKARIELGERFMNCMRRNLPYPSTR